MILNGIAWSRKTKYEMMRARQKTRDVTAYSKDQQSTESTLAGTSTTQMRTSQQQASSLLEQLPTELLQSIFLFSTNLDLPLCSKQLLSALSSDHLKFEIALQMLHYRSDRLSTAERSALLTRRFFDWKFVVRYAEFVNSRPFHWERKQKSSEMTGSDGSSLNDEDGNDESGTDNADDDETTSGTSDDADETNDDYHINDRHDNDLLTITSSVAYMTDAPVQLSDIDFHLSRIVELGTIATSYHGGVHLLDLTDVWPIIKRLRGLHGLQGINIPEKLLHGSWDDDRLRLLRLLVIFHCGIDHDEGTAVEAAQMGALDAIAHDEEEIVFLFKVTGTIIPPTQEMLRCAMLAGNLRILSHILDRGRRYLDCIDPVVWRLFDENTTWSESERRLVKKWLTQNDDSFAAFMIYSPNYQLRRRHVEVDSARWPSITANTPVVTTPRRVE